MWPSLESGLMIYDWDAGYRVFLGAERESAATLRTLCEEQTIRMTSYIQSEAMRNLEYAVTAAFDANADVPEPVNSEAAFTYNFQSFYPQMLDWVAASVIDLVVEQGVQPRDIVLIAPFLNDSLRFSLVNQLEDAQVPIVSHRPSRAIREEPAARAMLTMLQLANPAEASLPPAIDVADTLVQILGMDPIRARLLTQIVYGLGRNELGSFDVINARMQERITFLYGERYEMLREWLLQQASAVAATPPDYFLRSLFGDLAARPDFGFQTNLDAATVAGQLVDSAYSFRDALYPGGTDDWSPVWRVYRELVTEGLLAAFHPESWQKEEMNAVFIAPAYTYLMRNRPVDYQFWIDVGSPAWGERLEQPLTHPYVLRRDYPPDRKWTDEDEQDTNWDTLYRLTLGLVRRCRKQIFLGIADLGEQGFEQRGPLLSLFQQVLRPTGAL
ncbi:MAG: hypothetical protein GYB66_05775 [Chloroflexi bacterium]|nr:hypothetical protein [Chloroflexota bacterium]